MNAQVTIIGGGLAGSECALYLAKRGIKVRLFEMRPKKMTPAHNTGFLSELVCSNSLKSKKPENASGMLKRELELLGSSLIEIAHRCSVNAGDALAVDRDAFSRSVTKELENKLEIVREQITDIDELNINDGIVVIATGPLTSEALMNSLKDWFETQELHFFDAVSPIIDAQSIDYSKAFIADRYGEPDEEGNIPEGDYVNCLMDKDEYTQFYQALIDGEVIPIKDFERKRLFERCQPIEEIARSGVDAMRYGPMKPVGLIDPKTKKEPYAVVQLRKENQAGTMYNIVGFQTRLKWPEQKRIIRKIPGLQRSEILRYGVMHKNAYINSPLLLNEDFSSKKNENLFFAGQITGVEGYVESISSGHFVGMNIFNRLNHGENIAFPLETMMGGLFAYCSSAQDLKPMYANFGLLPALDKKVPKRQRRAAKSQRGLEVLLNFIKEKRIETGVEL